MKYDIQEAPDVEESEQEQLNYEDEVLEEIYTTPDELMENDEISPEEEGFMIGYAQA